MLLSQRDDGLTCRQRMLRAMMAESSSKTTSSLCKEEMKPRWDNAKKILADGLLGGPLQLLLKDNAASDEPREETVELFVLASEFSLLCALTTKHLQIRLWSDMPLYESQQSQMMELHPSSKAARTNNGVDHVPRNLLVLILRPAFSYTIEDTVHGPETNEHVVCKAIVAVAKEESPLNPLYRNDVGHRNSDLFGNFVPEIAEKLYGYFRPQFDMAPLGRMVFMRLHRSYSA